MLFAGNAVERAAVRRTCVGAAIAEVAGFTSLGVDLDPGITREDLAASIDAEFPDRIFNMGPNLEPNQLRTLRDGTRLEGRAIGALAALIALAAVFFVGQTVSRQTRLELRERHTLLALGATRRQLVGAVVARWLPVAVLAGFIAADGCGRACPHSDPSASDDGRRGREVCTSTIGLLATRCGHGHRRSCWRRRSSGLDSQPIAARSPIVVRTSAAGAGAVVSVALALLAGPWRRVTAPIGTAVVGHRGRSGGTHRCCHVVGFDPDGDVRSRPHRRPVRRDRHVGAVRRRIRHDRRRGRRHRRDHRGGGPHG